MKSGIIANSGIHYKPRIRAMSGKIQNRYFVCGGYYYSNHCRSSESDGGKFGFSYIFYRE